MRKIFILPLIILPLLSFADSEITPEIEVVGTRTSTPDHSPISTADTSAPPMTGGVRGGPGAGDLALMKAAKCAAVPQILKTASEEYSKCTDAADTQFNTDRGVCSSSSLITTTKGLTLTNGGTVGYSKVSVKGMTPKECNDIATTDHDRKMKYTCEANYSHAKDYATAMKEANCPK